MKLKVAKKIMVNAMLDKNYTSKKLSELTGLTKVTLSKMKNEKPCSYDSICKVAKALHVNAKELIADEEM